MEYINFLNENFSFFLILVAILSLFIGSLLNVVIYRLPRMIIAQWNQECREYLGLKEGDSEQLNLFLPFSHCPSCKKTLKPWHNIPILSYLYLRSRCAYCDARISMRYPLVEILCCLSSLYVAWRFGVTAQTAAGLLFTWILIALTFIDIEYQLLPDQLTFLLIWIGLVLSIFNIFTNTQDAIIGAVAGYSIFAITQILFKLITGKVGMGQGDYKLLAGLGAYLGWQQLPIIILLGSFIGIVFGVTQMVLKREFKSVPLAFGPYLAMAGWISLIWGPQLLKLYIHSFVV